MLSQEKTVVITCDDGYFFGDMPMACGKSWAGDQTRAMAAT